MPLSELAAFVLQNSGVRETILLAVCQAAESHHYLQKVLSTPKLDKLPSLVLGADLKVISL